MRSLCAALVAAFLLPASAYAQQAPNIGCIPGTQGPAGTLMKALDHNGYVLKVTTKESPKIAGMFYVNTKNEWIEIWVVKEGACIVDTGKNWMGAGEKVTAKPAPAPKGSAPDAPLTNPDPNGPSIDSEGNLTL